MLIVFWKKIACSFLKKNWKMKCMINLIIIYNYTQTQKLTEMPIMVTPNGNGIQLANVQLTPKKKTLEIQVDLILVGRRLFDDEDDINIPQDNNGAVVIVHNMNDNLNHQGWRC